MSVSALGLTHPFLFTEWHPRVFLGDAVAAMQNKFSLIRKYGT
jgi:hypothetical protein